MHKTDLFTTTLKNKYSELHQPIKLFQNFHYNLFSYQYIYVQYL